MAFYIIKTPEELEYKLSNFCSFMNIKLKLNLKKLLKKKSYL